MSAQPIAVIGLGGRFPGAPHLDAFWRNLRDGIESISRLRREDLAASGVDPDLLTSPGYVNARGILEDADMFDPRFFGYNARSATLLNPQHRVLLECSWQALENAGYDSERYSGTIGVFAGGSTNRYEEEADGAASTGFDRMEWQLANSLDTLAPLVAYKLNLRGPAITVQTACSTSLTALILACRSLAAHDCDMALAGAVTVRVPLNVGYLFREGGIASPDGHCRPFDAAAAGTVSGSGCGVVVLKRLNDAIADRDTIHGVVIGSALNNDGSGKIGFSAPSAAGQAEVIDRALRSAAASADSISYIECHGTATRLGDQIELEALHRALGVREDRTKTCAIGSVKSNVGHLDAAAGMAGLIKTILSLKHEQLPPSLHFERANPESCLDASRLFVNAALRPWLRSDRPRRAGVSSFGMGGTNTHVILEEPPASTQKSVERPWNLFVLSAKSAAALERMTHRLVDDLDGRTDAATADGAYTLQIGRRQFKHRRVVIARGSKGFRDAVMAGDELRVTSNGGVLSPRGVAFLFPGQGAQRARMAYDVYSHERVFREHIDACAKLLESELGFVITDLLYGTAAAAEAALAQTMYAQPTLFAVEYALAQLWRSWGVEPVALVGHSVGEYAAACVADVMSLADAARLVAARGHAMQSCVPGAMLAVALDEDEIRRWLSPDVELAAVNGPTQCALAGSASAIDASLALAAEGVIHQRVPTSHAFHSASIDPAVEEVRRVARGIEFRPPRIPIISTVDGRPLSDSTAIDGDYWATQTRHTVRFAAAIEHFSGADDTSFLEVGPGATLTGLARAQVDSPPGRLFVNSLAREGSTLTDGEALWLAAGHLWLAGERLDWVEARHSEARQRVPLPTYSFDRERCWSHTPRQHTEHFLAGSAQARMAVEALHSPGTFEASPTMVQPSVPVDVVELARTCDDIEAAVIGAWESVLNVSRPRSTDNFFVLGGDSLMMLQVVSRVRDRLRLDLSARIFFEAPTIEGVSARIRDLAAGQRSSQFVQALLDRVERLSAQELEVSANVSPRLELRIGWWELPPPSGASRQVPA